jgi:GT2 family glycosyltransferase
VAERDDDKSPRGRLPTAIAHGIRRRLSRPSKYERYIQAAALAEEPESKRRDRSQSFPYRPRISLIVPVYNTDKRWLRPCIESVLGQNYDNWELCIADGGSAKAHVRKILEEYAGGDSRIKVTFLEDNRGIAGNSNAALDLASGEFVGFLDHDDELTDNALYEVASLLNRDPGLDLIYSDEDKITTKGRLFGPHFKPDWAPDSLRSYNYICHFTVIRRSLVEDIGRFREGYDGSQDYDLLLRATEKTDRIAHIPKVLYHWRTVESSAASDRKAKMYAYANAKRALRDHVQRMSFKAEVSDGAILGSYRVRYQVERSREVAIIIQTRDNSKSLKRCIDSIKERTSFDNYWIHVVDAQGAKAETLEYYDQLRRRDRLTVTLYPGQFNRSAMNNFCASRLDPRYVVFLREAVAVVSPDWIETMLELAQRQDVGAVGPLLCYPNQTVYHAGVIVGLLEGMGHSHRRLKKRSSGYFGRRKLVQNLSAVSGACLMTRRDVLQKAGGFDENYRGPFGAVDFCLKIRNAGYLIAFTPYAELRYHGAARRHPALDDDYLGATELKAEAERFRNDWAKFVDGGDPYYNPNLTLEKEDFSIRLL